MRRGIAIALLVVGIVLIVWGYNATQTLNSEITEFFTGSPSNKAIWMLAIGIGAAVVGFFTLVFPSKKRGS